MSNVDIIHFANNDMQTVIENSIGRKYTMSTKKIIETKEAPGAIGPYSQGVVAGDFLFLSGQLPLDPATGKMPEEGIVERAHQVFRNCRAVVEAAGASLDEVVKTTVFLTDLNDFQAVNTVYGEYFKAPFPARSAIQVAALPLGADIEVEAIINLQ